MNLRTLLNLAYAALAENRDKEQMDELDLILDGADVTWARAKAGQQARKAAPVTSPAERMLRSVPNDPRGLMATMARLR